MNERLFGICGPTASGKTELAIEVCEQVGGEIVSSDSMQVYTGMDILSAKPSENELKRAPHHLVGIVFPNAKYNASKFVRDANEAIRSIKANRRTPILCGGTGLYIDALTKGLRMSSEADDAIRSELKRMASEPDGKVKLYEMLYKVDPSSALKYGINDTRRIIRSLEIFMATGSPRKESEEADKSNENPYEAKLYALKWSREELYNRVNRRVEEMLKQGLIDEVKLLTKEEESVRETAAQAIGYKEIKLALDGCISMDEAIDLIKTHTRHLAKRQETWFKRDERVTWLETDGTNFDILAKQIAKDILEDKNDREC